MIKVSALLISSLLLSEYDIEGYMPLIMNMRKRNAFILSAGS